MINDLTKTIAIIIVILIVAGVFWSYYFFIDNENSGNMIGENTFLISGNCSSVSSGDRDKCCYKRLKERGWPKCPNILIYYDETDDKCKYECSGSVGIFCTEEAQQCPDGSWTSRTPVLDCQFIPCGYNKK